MKKGERLDIEVSVLATEDIQDHEAEFIAVSAMKAARDVMLQHRHFKRLGSGISISSAIRRLHRRRYARRGRTETPSSEPGNIQ